MIDEATHPAKQTPQDIVEREAAARLIARLHDPNWTDAKQDELETWLSASIAHEVSYLRLEAGWHGADRLAVLRQPSHSEMFRPNKPSGANRFHVAAILVLCTAIGAAWYVTDRPNRDQVFETPVGGRETVTLADGSQIELNTSTQLRLHKGSRQATLVRGEAYFQIKHDAAHPFMLDAGSHRIVDLGTKFVVRQKDSELKVTLLEGSARIESVAGQDRSPSAVLHPGDVAMTNRDDLRVTHNPANSLYDALSWRSGFVIFRHTTLGDAVSELNRYNAEQIVVANSAAASRIFGGKFRTTDSERFADVVGAALGLHVEHRGNEIVISQK